MNSPSPTRSSALIFFMTVAALGLGVIGCSPKGTSQIAAGDRYFAAGDYDRAEIEYKNALQAKNMQDVHAIGRIGIIYYQQGRLRQAIPFLLKARELQSEDLEVRTKVGMVHIIMGKPKEAREEAEYVLERNASSEVAPLLLAQASVGTPADMIAAETRLKTLLNGESKGAPVLTAMGVIELARKNLPAAEALLHRAIAANPKSATAHSALASVYFAKKDRASAELSLKAAAENAPLRSNEPLQYARYKIQTGDLGTAQKLLVEISNRAPDYLPAQSLLAEIAALEKRYDDSASLVAKVLAKDPAQAEAGLLSARLKLARGDSAKAAEDLETFLKIYPSSPQALYFLGLSYAATGEKIKAVDRLSQAIKIAPMPEAILALANVNLRNGDTSAVILGLRPFVEKHPENMQARLMLANAYRSQGDHDMALSLYKSSAEAFPNDPSSVYQAGLALLQQNKITEAREAFTEALRRNAGFTPALEQLVNLDLRGKDTTSALRRIDAEKVRDPNSVAASLLAGKVFESTGEASRAETEYKRAIELRPEIPTAYFQLARLYVSTQQQEKALASLKSVTDRNPKDATALLVTGLILNDQNNHVEARDAYEKVLVLNPKSTVALNNLAYIYSEKLGNLDKGFELAQKARELLPDEPHTADTLGWILYKKKQFARALALLEESAVAIPQNAELQYHLGVTRYAMELEEPARQALSRALELDPSLSASDEIRRRLDVLALTAQTVPSEAIRILELSLSAFPDDAVALSKLASVHEAQGSPQKAISTFERAIDANPSSLNAWTSLTRLYAEQGRFPQSLDAAKTARRLAPDDPDIAWILGTSVHRSGDSTWAASLLREAARKKPHEPELLLDAAHVLYAVGQIESAEEMVKQAVEDYGSREPAKSPNSNRAAEAKTFHSMIRLVANPDPNAIREIDEVLAHDPRNAAALMAKGTLQEKSASANDAFNTYESVLAQLPNFPPVKLRLAMLAATQINPDKRALDWAQQAKNAYPNNTEASKALAILTFRQGDAGRAVGLLKQVTASSPKDAELLYYLGRAQIENKETAPGHESLKKALSLNLRPDLAAEATRLLKQK